MLIPYRTPPPKIAPSTHKCSTAGGQIAKFCGECNNLIPLQFQSFDHSHGIAPVVTGLASEIAPVATVIIPAVFHIKFEPMLRNHIPYKKIGYLVIGIVSPGHTVVSESLSQPRLKQSFCLHPVLRSEEHTSELQSR